MPFCVSLEPALCNSQSNSSVRKSHQWMPRSVSQSILANGLSPSFNVPPTVYKLLEGKGRFIVGKPGSTLSPSDWGPSLTMGRGDFTCLLKWHTEDNQSYHVLAKNAKQTLNHKENIRQTQGEGRSTRWLLYTLQKGQPWGLLAGPVVRTLCFRYRRRQFDSW